ncbi:hypothetical protein AYI70_g5037 [Smittium culicis]|uniref:Uncharacterized protein n=1 Tax=Smittium culicis TaxID=133412 RepID=A0A1R1XW98_9FUNG|nr:hypothetical protein AYI70_g5037 [Smittium culicis]
MFPISQSISKISNSSIQLCRQITIRPLSTIKVSDQTTTEGDLNALKSELDPLFGKENVSIKKINNSILIKGICSREVRQFLFKKGF